MISDSKSAIHDLASVVVDCRPPKKTDWADVAIAGSSRILYEPREGGSRRQRSDSRRITTHPVFAQSAGVFALRKSRPRAARKCRLQLLLGFCIDLFSDSAVAIRIAETARTRSSITPQLIPLPHAHAFAPLGLGGIKPMSPARPHQPLSISRRFSRFHNMGSLRNTPAPNSLANRDIYRGSSRSRPASPAFLVAESKR
jgi:hypothetical protein